MFNLLLGLVLAVITVLPMQGEAVVSREIDVVPAFNVTNLPSKTRMAVKRTSDFLKSQYVLEIGLLEESPKIGKGNFYLSNCNYLGPRVLELLGEKKLSEKILETKKAYKFSGNGFIEVASGEAVTWPPNHHCDIEIARVGDNRILQEFHDRDLCQRNGFFGGYFADWQEYANLTFMGVLNEYNKGNIEYARQMFRNEIGRFNGIGFKDLAYQKRALPENGVEGVYETLGVAWALYAGSQIGAFDDPDLKPVGEKLVAVLLANQGPSGGVHTHYIKLGTPLADPNIETTSVAVLGILEFYR